MNVSAAVNGRTYPTIIATLCVLLFGYLVYETRQARADMATEARSTREAIGNVQSLIHANDKRITVIEAAEFTAADGLLVWREIAEIQARVGVGVQFMPKTATSERK